MNNDINIASRATLFNNMDDMHNYFNSKIKDIWEFYSSYSSTNKIHQSFVNGTVLASLYSALEILLNDTSIRFLISYPGHISSKIANKFDIVTENDSVSTIIRHYAEHIINELSYKDLKTYLENIYNFFGEKLTLEADKLGLLIEGKASRDIFIHNNSVINDVYLNRAGSYARYKQTGKELEIDFTYLTEIKNCIEILSNDFKTHCLDKYRNDNKENIFKKMWEMSSLNRIVPFGNVWDLTDGHLSFNGDFHYLFSSSENALYRFFRYIFHGEDPEPEHSISSNCIAYALQCWRGTINERIIFSWFEYPFYL